MQITTESSVASMNKPKISIIVPVYNTELYLRECIESILRQSYVDFEVLLVDDGSTDASGSICEDYAAKDTRIRVFHQDNQGVSSARNLALDHVQGRYVLFLDADDFWYVDTCLETLVNEALRTGADIVRGEYKAVDEQGNDLFARKINRRKMKLAYRLVSSVTYGWTTIWDLLTRKELYRKYNIFSLSGATYCEDFHLAVRLLFHADKVVHIDDAGYFYNRANQTSFMYSRDEKSMRDEQTVYLDIIDFFKKHQVYDNYRKQMCWRILKSKQDWLLGT